MTSHVVSVKPAAAPAAPKVKPSAASAAPPAKKFDHVLGHARTQAAKPSRGKQGGVSKKTAANAKAATSPQGKSAAGKRPPGATDPDQQEEQTEQAGQPGQPVDEPVDAKGLPTAKSGNSARPTEQNEEDAPVVSDTADTKDTAQTTKGQNVAARVNPDGKSPKDSASRHAGGQDKRGNDDAQANTPAALAQGQVAPMVIDKSTASSAAIATLPAQPAITSVRGGGSRKEAADSPDSADPANSAASNAAASSTNAPAAQNSLPGPAATADVETDDGPAPVAAVTGGFKTSAAAAPLQTAEAPAAPVKSGAASTAAAAAPAQTAPTEAQFAGANHENIASSIRGQLMPAGGTMHIRLDPPELGPMQIHVKIDNGVVSASFQTSSDQATKLLSHSLSQLKQALENQGVTVDRLHVEQAPKSDAKSDAGSKQSSDGSSNGQSGQTPERGSQQDQQRREILRRMWRRVAGGGDPLDLVA